MYCGELSGIQCDGLWTGCTGFKHTILATCLKALPLKATVAHFDLTGFIKSFPAYIY